MKDKYGFVKKKKNCAWCQDVFYIQNQLRTQDKYCGTDCAKQAFHEKQQERIKTLKEKKVDIFCKNCKKPFKSSSFYIKVYCTKSCQAEQLSKTRIGEDNPAYYSGLYIKSKKKEYSNQTYKHLKACTDYRKDFLNRNSYLYCEVCGVNQNYTPRFQVHHIYFASKYPRHKELNNFKNLILVCLTCHQSFHAGKKYEEHFLKLQEERGLKELFTIVEN